MNEQLDIGGLAADAVEAESEAAGGLAMGAALEEDGAGHASAAIGPSPGRAEHAEEGRRVEAFEKTLNAAADGTRADAGGAGELGCGHAAVVDRFEEGAIGGVEVLGKLDDAFGVVTEVGDLPGALGAEVRVAAQVYLL